MEMTETESTENEVVASEPTSVPATEAAPAEPVLAESAEAEPAEVELAEAEPVLAESAEAESAEAASAGAASTDDELEAEANPVEEAEAAAPDAVAEAESAASESSAEPSDEPGHSTEGMNWYVVQAYSGYENKVKLSLEERIRRASLEDQFGEILIPKENVQDNRAGNRRVTSRNFYPGYIFVQMHLSDRAWHLIKDTMKVSGFVGGRHPAPVPEREIQVIAQQVAEGAAKPKPRVMFEQGDHVRVIDGAFANFTGSVEEVNPDKAKVRVLVSIFGRATPVELDFVQVEKTV